MTALLDMTIAGFSEQGVRTLLENRRVWTTRLSSASAPAGLLADLLGKWLGLTEPRGELDISFYRDDFSRIGLNPRVRPSSLPFETEGRDILLIDDVIMSGRTIRAAMNEIFDYGRPASIMLATLIDLGARELPIQPDVTGKTLSLKTDQRVKLKGPDPLRLEFQEASQS